MKCILWQCPHELRNVSYYNRVGAFNTTTLQVRYLDSYCDSHYSSVMRHSIVTVVLFNASALRLKTKISHLWQTLHTKQQALQPHSASSQLAKREGEWRWRGSTATARSLCLVRSVFLLHPLDLLTSLTLSVTHTFSLSHTHSKQKRCRHGIAPSVSHSAQYAHIWRNFQG